MSEKNVTHKIKKVYQELYAINEAWPYEPSISSIYGS